MNLYCQSNNMLIDNGHICRVCTFAKILSHRNAKYVQSKPDHPRAFSYLQGNELKCCLDFIIWKIFISCMYFQKMCPKLPFGTGSPFLTIFISYFVHSRRSLEIVLVHLVILRRFILASLQEPKQCQICLFFLEC